MEKQSGEEKLKGVEKPDALLVWWFSDCSY